MKTLFFSFLTLAVLAGPASAQVTALDSTYAPDVNGTVHLMANAGAGSYYIAGDFTQVGGTALSRIARLTATGALDTSFDPGISANAAIFALQPVAGGSVLVGGGFTQFNGSARPALVRLSSAGVVDASVSTTATLVTAMATSGTNLYTAGNFPRSDAPGQYSFRIVRMAYPTGFTGNNYDPAYNEPTVTGIVYCLFVQMDGKLLIGGDFTAVNGTARANLARLNADGTLDTTFTLNAAGGAVRTLVDYAPGAGHVVVAGEFTAMNGNGGYAYYALVKLSNGSVASTYQPAANGAVRGVVSYGSGKALLVGDFTTIGGVSRTRIARVDLLSGRVDPALNLTVDGSVRAVMLDANKESRVLLGGAFSSVGGSARARVARLLPFGGIDTDWPQATGGEVRAVAMQPNGDALIGGAFTAIGGSTRTSLGRVTAAGTLDATYAPAIDGQINAIAALPDGRAIIGGLFSNAGGVGHANLARLASNGTSDVGFDLTTNGEVFAIAQQSDGKSIVAGNFTTIGGITRIGIARLNADGTVDTAFDASLDGHAKAVVVQSDGKILIGGDFLTVGGTAHARLARVDSAGLLDATFVATAGGAVRTLGVDALGGILVGGEFVGGSSFGQLWATYLTSTGTVAAAPPFVNGAVRTSAILSNGTTHIGGTFSTIAGSAASPHIRLTNLKTAPGLPITGTTPSVRAIAFRGDGAAIIGGSFSSFGDSTRSNLGLWVNGEAASSVITVNSTGSSVTWARSGTLPLPAFVVFDLSTDAGVTWTSLGESLSPIFSGGAWTSTKTITTPVGVSYLVRARGLVGDGASSGWIQAVSTAQIRELPTISVQPADLTVNPSGSATFSVTATSPTAMTYQWLKDGIPITGAVSSSYTFSPALPASAGLYSVVVTNLNGSTTSRDALLTVRAAVAITTQPSSLTLPAGTPATLVVEATGDSPTYQWQYYTYGYRSGFGYGYYWASITGATSASYTTTDSVSQLKVLVSNAFSSVQSNTVSVTFVSSPTIYSQPFDTLVNEGSSFYLSLNGSTNATLQWYKDDVIIPGANSATFLKTASLSDSGLYKCVMTNISGSVTSRVATVTVSPRTAPVITQQPQPLLVALASQASLSIKVSGLLPMGLQWRRNGARLEGANGNSFDVGLTMSDSGLYSCTIGNDLGSVISRYVNVAVVDTAAHTHSLPLHGSAQFNAPTTALGVTYRWQMDGVDLPISNQIASVTSATLTIKDLALSDAGDYTCIIGNGAATLVGGINTLIVQDQVPTITTTTLEDATLAKFYDVRIEATHLPTKFTVTNLPPGLKIDASGRLNGTPTKPGTYNMKTLAANGVGNSAAKTLSLKVLALPVQFSGRFMGVEPITAVRSDLVIASSGIVTGTIRMGGTYSARVKTALSIDSSTIATVKPITVHHPMYGNLSISGVIDSSAEYPVLSLNIGYQASAGDNVTITVQNWQNTWTKQDTPEAFAGYHTASFAPLSGYVTEGFGFGAITVSKTGSTTVSGRMPDGTVHSTSGFVGPLGEVPFFSSALKGKSLVCGVMTIFSGTTPNFYDNTVGGSVTWTRGSIPGRLYPAGVSGSMPVSGNKYLKPNTPDLTGPIVMNLNNLAENAMLSFSTLDDGASSGSSLGRISTANKFSLQPGGAFSSASVTINASTGTFKATGTYYSTNESSTESLKRSGTGYGIIISDPISLGGVGRGFVILPQLPRNEGETLRNTPQTSGAVYLGIPF